MAGKFSPVVTRFLADLRSSRALESCLRPCFIVFFTNSTWRKPNATRRKTEDIDSVLRLARETICSCNAFCVFEISRAGQRLHRHQPERFAIAAHARAGKNHLSSQFRHRLGRHFAGAFAVEKSQMRAADF